MGLLDELEQEAQRRKAGADDVERLKQERETAYRTQLEPGMVALHEDSVVEILPPFAGG